MKKMLLAAIGALMLSTVSFASHSWSNYHWARTTSSFDLTIVNSTTSDWDPYVSQAVSDWSNSTKLNMIEDPNSNNTSKKTRRQCRGPAGQVRICNLAYGNTGWLGIAGISLDNNGHISTGYTKLNDTYFNQSYYNTPAWKQSVTCQELGHNVGLGHQDEDFNNQSLFSCMDYQDPPYAYPNAHDFDQLVTMYGHTDSYNSYDNSSGAAPPSGCSNPSGNNCKNGDVGWGQSLGRRGQHETFIRIDADGTRHITHVTWALGEGDDHH